MEGEKRRILVVDDEPEIVDTLKHFLSTKGYEAIGAFSGEEALGILEKERLDLILLDIMMPGLKGGELAKIIKEKYPFIKVIVITGYPKESESLSKDNLLEGLFIKPIRIQEIYNKLLEVLPQEETPILKGESKKGIMVRVILIKAKLLFIEPSFEVYNFLSKHFKGLSHRGENYATEAVFNAEDIIGKLTSFNPDIFVINASFFKEYSANILPKVLEKNLCPKEIIVYNIHDMENLQKAELEKLTKAVEIACLKNGLIEVKWIEI